MKNIVLILIICLISACKDKLELKPNTSIVLPETAQELESLLEYSTIVNVTSAFAQVSADEYFIVSLAAWQSTGNAAGRNAAVWAKDIYAGETKSANWVVPYNAVFFANSVLDILATQNIDNDIEKNRVKGRALFIRAFTFYSLVSVFSKAYNAELANTDLGIPLKLNGNVDEIVQRSSVQQTYDQIIKDALEAADLLNKDIIANKRNQPSKVAAYAFLARVYTSMRKYDLAELYADKALALYSKLIDFNTLNTSTTSAFNYNAEETIYFTNINANFSYFTNGTSNSFGIDPTLISLFEANDSRLQIYFRKNAAGNYTVKPINSLDIIPFSGLATDELYLIKAECLARRDQGSQAMDYLNQLGIKRWNPNATIPAKSYQNITANSPQNALERVLIERRKALVWRSLRWTDIKRLNLEGRNITLSRKIGDQIYTLEPNSPRYVLPIPDDEVLLSNIQQNIR